MQGKKHMYKVEINNRELISLINKKRWVVLIFFFFGLAGSIIYINLRPIIYTASSSFVTAQKQGAELNKSPKFLQPKLVDFELATIAAKEGVSCKNYNSETKKYRLNIFKDKNNVDVYNATYISNDIAEAENCLRIYLAQIEWQDNLNYERQLKFYEDAKKIMGKLNFPSKNNSEVNLLDLLYLKNEIGVRYENWQKFTIINPLKVSESNSLNLLEKIFIIFSISSLGIFLSVLLITLSKLNCKKILEEK
jgi:hypothetical protein